MKKDNLKAFKQFAILSGLFILISCILAGVSVFPASLCYALTSADEELPPQVYINNTDKPVQAVRGQSIEIPVLIVGGYAQHQRSELYIWREQGNDTYCFDGNEWTLVSGDSTDCEPLVEFEALPHHVYWGWTSLSSAEYLENCTLHICFDDMIDGVLTEGSLHCGEAVIEVSEDSSGFSSGGDSGSGSGSQSGSSSEGDNGSGSGSQTSQPSGPGQGTLTPPTFIADPSSSGDSTQCNSLSYTKAGEMSSWTKRVSLNAGTTTPTTFNVSVQACGKNVSVTRVSGGESWMSVSKDDNGGILFKFNTSELAAGQYTSSTVNVTAGGISNSFEVSLTVQGECDSSSLDNSSIPSSLTFSVVEGHDSDDPQYVEVKNGCGELVDVDELTVDELTSEKDWLNVAENPQGKLMVSISSSELEIGSYKGRITFKDSLKGETHTVDVYLTVRSTSTPTDDDITITYVDSPYYFRNISLEGGEVRCYRFRAGVSKEGESISIRTGSSPYVHMLVQRGGEEPPDMNDYDRTKDLPPKVNGNGEEPELFWDRGGSEAIIIRELMEPQDFYVMLYNDSDNDVHQGLRIDWNYPL